jgi:hypothetical protein
MIPISNYKKFISELIRKHMVILGPNIARDTALRVAGLSIDASGDVLKLDGDPLLILKSLTNAYTEFSAPVTHLVLSALLEAYPEVKAEYNQPLPKINLSCAITVAGQRS